MSNDICIRPSEDIKDNYSQISMLSRKSPVIIAVNGKEDVVIINYNDYMQQQEYVYQLESKIALYEHLAKAEKDIKRGMVNSPDIVFNEIIKDLKSTKRNQKT